MSTQPETDSQPPSTTTMTQETTSQAGPSSSTSPLFGKKKTPKVPKPQPPKPEPKAKPKPVAVGPFDKPDEEEEKNVHEVYEAIAGHFSQTRHKPWPFIEKFLHSLPPNSIGLDSGAGNGKYLPSSRNAGLEMIALDRSSGLLEIARTENGGECLRGDLCFQGWRRDVFDFAISIAAIHHLSTPERRRQAVKSLIRPLRLSSSPTYSKFMIYVWAYEQGSLSKRKMGTLTKSSPSSTPVPNTTHPATSPLDNTIPSSDSQNDSSISSTGGGGQSEHSKDQNTTQEDEGVKEVEEKIQDLLVPWVYSKPPSSSSSKSKSSRSKAQSSTPTTKAEETPEAENETNNEEQKPEPKVYHRYYHLFLEGELRELVIQSGIEDGFEILPDGVGGKELEDAIRSQRETQRQGEKGEGVEGKEAGKKEKKWLRIRGVGWEADNWWIEGEVGLY